MLVKTIIDIGKYIPKDSTITVSNYDNLYYYYVDNSENIPVTRLIRKANCVEV